MRPHKRISTFLLILLLTVGGAGTVAEQTTLTTYYPAPNGVYQSIQLVPSPATSVGGVCTQPGLLEYTSSHEMVYCQGSPSATPTWSAMSGVWRRSGGEISPNDPDWNVGIGTSGPFSDKLTIQTPDASFGWVHTNGTLRLASWINSADPSYPIGGWIGMNNAPIHFYTDEASTIPRMTIDNDSVDIVSGDLQLAIGSQITSEAGAIIRTTPATGLSWRVRPGVGASEIIQFRDETASPRVTIDAAGNVGIGTETPGSLLELQGDTAPGLTIHETTSGERWFLGTVAGGDITLANLNTGIVPLYIWGSGLETIFYSNLRVENNFAATGEISIGGLEDTDDIGRVVCVRADHRLGTCRGSLNPNGTCGDCQ